MQQNKKITIVRGAKTVDLLDDLIGQLCLAEFPHTLKAVALGSVVSYPEESDFRGRENSIVQ